MARVMGLAREPAGEPVKKKKTVSGQKSECYTHRWAESGHEDGKRRRRRRRRRRRGKR
jgi:hypothetical protein